MIVRTVLYFCVLSDFVVKVVASTADELDCENKDDCSKLQLRLEDELDLKWEPYLTKIKEAVNVYEDCDYDEDGCSECYNKQIDRDLEPWKDGITRDLLDIAAKHATHYQIIDHKVYRESKCIFEPRCMGVEYFLTRLAADLPDMELKVNMFDHPLVSRYHIQKAPIFSFSKGNDHVDIMYPAWTFWTGGPAVWPIFPTGQGDWAGTREWLTNIGKTQFPWEKKTAKGFFIGSRTSGDRDPLILLSREKPDLVEASYTKNQAYKGPKDTLHAEPVAPKNYDEHCPYKFLFNFRGVAASFRFKHLFLCGSVVYHVGDEWLEFFYPSLKPWVHYIPVKQDLSDVEKLLMFGKENDAVLQQIAHRGFQFIDKHLRQEDIFLLLEEAIAEVF